MAFRNLFCAFLFLISFQGYSQMDTLGVINASNTYWVVNNFMQFDDYSLLVTKNSSSSYKYYSVSHHTLGIDSFTVNSTYNLDYARVNPIQRMYWYSNYFRWVYSVNKKGFRTVLFEFDDPKSESEMVQASNNGLRYYSGIVADTFRVIETDGSKMGTRVVFASVDSVAHIFPYKDSMVFVTQNQGGFEYHIGKDGVFHPAGFLDLGSLQLDYHPIEENETGVFLNYEDANGNEAVGFLDFSQGVSFSKFLDLGHLDNMIIKDGFVYAIHESWSSSQQFWMRMSQNELQNIDTICDGGDISTYSIRVLKNLGDSLFLTYSNNQGYEWATLNALGNFDVIDFAPGVNSSLPVNLAGATFNNTSFFYSGIFKGNYFHNRDDGFIMSNGNDNLFYWYDWINNAFECKFQVPNPENIFAKMGNSQHHLVFVKTDSTIVVLKNEKGDQKNIQPPKKVENTVFMQVGNTNDLHYYLYGNPIRVERIVEDNEGNWYIGYYSDSFNGNNQRKTVFQRVVGDTARNEINAKYVIIKVDSNGGLKWTNSFGPVTSMVFSSPVFDFDVNQGKVVVGGTAGYHCYFNESYRSEVRNQTFLMQIDVNTGDEDWIRFITPSYDYQWVEDLKLRLSGNSEIVLGLKFKGKLNIQGNFIGDKEWPYEEYTAVVKLNKSGNFQWAQKMSTSASRQETSIQDLILSKNSDAIYFACKLSNREFDNNSCFDFTEKLYLYSLGQNGAIQNTLTINSSAHQSLIKMQLLDDDLVRFIGWFQKDLSVRSLSMNQLNKSDCRNKQLYYMDWNSVTNSPFNFRYVETQFSTIKSVSLDKEKAFLVTQSDDELIKGWHMDLVSNTIKSRVMINENFKHSLYYSHFNKSGKIYTSICNAGPDSSIQFQSLVNNYPSVSILKWNESQFEEDSELLFSTPDASLTQENFLWMYPNPATESLNISVFDADRYDEYQIFDVQGRLIRQQDIVQDLRMVIDVSILKNGMYFIRLVGPTDALTRKFCVFHPE